MDEWNDWEGFFKRHSDDRVEVCYFGVCVTVTVEELYQAFKARLRAEEQDHE